MSRGIGDRPFDSLAHAPQARTAAHPLLPHTETPAARCPGLLELRVQRRQRFLWACLVGIALVFAGRFLYLSVQHLHTLNRYVEWSSNGPLPSVLSDADGRLRLPPETHDRLTKLMHELSLSREQTEPLTQQSPLIVPEANGSTSPDVCRIDYGGSARDLCRSLARLPDSKTWNDLEPSLQSLLAGFASAMPTKREIGCNGSDCYPARLADWLGLTPALAAGYPLVAPLIYLADDRGDVDKAESVISYPKRTVSSGYKIGDRPWYREPVEGNPDTWLTLNNSGPVARCALTDPYQDVGSVFGIVRTLVCWPIGEAAADLFAKDLPRPRFLLAIDLWWADELPAWPATTIDAALHVEQTLPVSIAIVALLICVLALVSLRHQRHDLVYLVRCASLDGAQRDKSIVREVGTKTEKQAGVKLAGSIAAWFSAEATHRHHNAQTESLVLRVDYEQEPDVRGIELWEIYCLREHSFELLGLCLLVRWGVHAPRWTSIVTHTAESLPRVEYLAGHPAHAHNTGLAERIEAQIRSGIQGELRNEPVHTRSSLLSTSKLPRSFPELARYQKQTERLSAGRFRFRRDVEVVTSLYPQAEIEAVQRLPDLLHALTDERRLLLQLGHHMGRVALCESEQEWEEARSQQRESLYALSQLVGASRLRIGFAERLAPRLQRQNIRDFGLLDKRTLIVFDRQTAESSGYVSTKRADVAFYRYVFEALWSTGKRFEV